jgi:hypothetical protein
LHNSDLAAKIYAARCALAQAITRKELCRDARAVPTVALIICVCTKTRSQRRLGLRIDKATAAVVGERCALRRCHRLAGDPVEAGGVVIVNRSSWRRGDCRGVRACSYFSRVGSVDALARLTNPTVACGIGDAAYARGITRLTEGWGGVKRRKGKPEDRER